MRTKSEDIAAILEDQIITCQFEPGESLFEVDLARQFKVSRTPVREALLKLERRGLIRSVPYKGFAVNAVSLKDVMELYELRLLLEVNAAGLAAERGKMTGEFDVSELEKIVSRDYDSQDFESQRSWVDDNHLFHLMITDLAQNRRIRETLANILKQLQRVYFLGLKNRMGEADHVEHREIVKAIRAGAIEQARRSMEHHIAVSQKRIMDLL